MNQPTEDYSEVQLPGYTLVSRIGAGGYGEVWLAHAPGGLDKAVKIIFGYHNEKRAERELHSLEKIKEVRHPFLLSLERIEVIDGRLIIVTELADASLKDRFDACRQEGLPGIPREELLHYLRDTADALDYLNNNYSLQHLDVKPENLLLLAGHVKVADFGLVKEIQNTQASLVGGMTPVYSAPEVFQGTPSSFSDQYSLAVLYQEMLSGKLPFDGVTSAELTLQHMHDEPELSHLPMGDRYVLARALSKAPESRYASCSDMVQALLCAEEDGESSNTKQSYSTKNQPTVERRPIGVETNRNPGSVTQVFEDDLENDAAKLSQSMLFESPTPADPKVCLLPPLDLPSAGFQPTPTLFIGIGGTAGKVLQQLKQRINRHHGSASQVPAMQMLLLDTDSKAIAAATLNEDAGLTSEETLTLPLRRPQEYRERSQFLLQWLSRRWLYNIPKSLRTEGLRPLGRLAFVDHARRTIQRIRHSLTQAIDKQSIAESTQHTGLEFQTNAVRVCVVSSISGGTGSGMSLDVGYAVQAVLKKLGVESASTTGIFLHSTGRDSRYSDLAKVNAYSWLTEFNHFHRPGGFYPGDQASGLPAGEPGKAAFDDTYLVHLGNCLNEEQLKDQADTIAKYMYLDCWTSAHAFFDSSRKNEIESNVVTLRTFGLQSTPSTPQPAIEQVADQLCQRIVRSWSEGNNNQDRSSKAQTQSSAPDCDTSSISKTNPILPGAAHAVVKLQINLQGIAANARAIIEGQFGNHAEQLITKMLTRMPETGQPATAEEMLQVVDGLFEPQPNTDVQPGSYVMGRSLDAVVSPLGMKLSTDLQQWVLGRLDNRQERLAGTQDAAEWFAKHFERVEAESQRLASGLRQQISATSEKLKNKIGDRDTNEQEQPIDVATEAIRYFRLRLDLSALEATSQLTRQLESTLKSLRETIIEFGRHLRSLAESLEKGQSTATESNNGQHDLLVSMFQSRLDELQATTDLQLQEEFIDRHNGLFQTVMSNGRVVAELMSALKAIAIHNVEQLARELTNEADSLTQQANQFQGEPTANTLLKFGGTTRRLVALPQTSLSENAKADLRERWGSQTSLLAVDEKSDLAVCCEAWHVPPVPLAIDIIECRRDYADFAKRVHTRNDVDWMTLLESTATPEANEPKVFATQVL